MKKIALLGTALALMLSVQMTGAADKKGVSDEQIGLSKTGVNDVPDPQVFEYRNNAPFSGKVLPRAYQGAPPQVPHNLEGFIPITRDANACIGCHQQPSMIGKKTKGQPTPMPISHYVDAKASAMNMGRYNCTQCHTPQATVKPLVGNTFSGKK